MNTVNAQVLKIVRKASLSAFLTGMQKVSQYLKRKTRKHSGEKKKENEHQHATKVKQTHVLRPPQLSSRFARSAQTHTHTLFSREDLGPCVRSFSTAKVICEIRRLPLQSGSVMSQNDAPITLQWSWSTETNVVLSFHRLAKSNGSTEEGRTMYWRHRILYIS